MRNRRLCRPAVLLLLFLFVLFCLPGCAVVPVISGLREMGVSADARQELLRKDLRAFYNAVQTGRTAAALQFVAKDSPEVREQLLQELRSAHGKQRVVEGEVDYIDFGEDSRTADVDMRVRYFKIPYYIVKERTERVKWQWYASAGWRLVAREVIEDEV